MSYTKATVTSSISMAYLMNSFILYVAYLHRREPLTIYPQCDDDLVVDNDAAEVEVSSTAKVVTLSTIITTRLIVSIEALIAIRTVNSSTLLELH